MNGLEVSGMRTARVSAVPSSIFRNKRQYLHSNELFHKVLDEGNFSSFRHNQQNNKNNQQGKQKQATKVVLNRMSKGTVIKGLLIDCNEILQFQNNLLKRATKISEARNKKTYINSYRSSI